MVTNDLNGKPFQLGFVRPAQMMMFAKIVSDPPLGQVTVIPHHHQAVYYLTVLSSFVAVGTKSTRSTLLFSSSQVGFSRSNLGMLYFGIMGYRIESGTNCRLNMCPTEMIR